MSLDITGSWTLQRFNIHAANGTIEPWGRDTHGLLIYGPSGHMSVSINAAAEGSDAASIFDSILFYSGTYTVADQVITHLVTEASNPSRINKEMVRFAKLEGDVLTLTTPEESFGKAVLVWKKIK